jgi:hypothetical protein
MTPPFHQNWRIKLKAMLCTIRDQLAVLYILTVQYSAISGEEVKTIPCRDMQLLIVNF